MFPLCYQRALGIAALSLILVAACITPAMSGIRAPGKYSGVVIFDRWDTCFLLSGLYITYISSAVKEGLRPYAGQAIEIDATSVTQPVNPGDGLIRQYQVVGPAPEPKYLSLTGVELLVRSHFDKGTPTFDLEIRNQSESQIEVRTNQIGITLMAPSNSSFFNPSDGKSSAVITRSALYDAGLVEVLKHEPSYRPPYSLEGESIPVPLVIQPHASYTVRITLRIKPGEYQFLIGYGDGVNGGRALASNMISFSVLQSGSPTLDVSRR